MRAGSYEMASTLVANGAWVEQVCQKKWTAMHEAAKVGQVDILMLLLRNGGRVNHRDVTGVTPLAVAAEHGHYNVTEILLNCGQSADKTEVNLSDFTKAIQEIVTHINTFYYALVSPLSSPLRQQSQLSGL